MQLSGQILDLTALLLWYETGYSLNRISDRPQARSGHFGQETNVSYFYVDPVDPIIIIPTCTRTHA